MAISSYRDDIIQRMSSHGYHYNKIDSYPHHLVFDYDGQSFPLTFKSWSEADDWEKNTVFD